MKRLPIDKLLWGSVVGGCVFLLVILLATSPRKVLDGGVASGSLTRSMAGPAFDNNSPIEDLGVSEIRDKSRPFVAGADLAELDALVQRGHSGDRAAIADLSYYSSAALHPLANMVTNRDGRVRIAALQTIQRILRDNQSEKAGDADFISAELHNILPWVSTVLHDESAPVRVEALRTLAAMRGAAASAIPQMRVVVKSLPDAEFQRAGQRALNEVVRAVAHVVPDNSP